jgi:hypothetical protein
MLTEALASASWRAISEPIIPEPTTMKSADGVSAIVFSFGSVF